jgi:LacI family transcriptional regulator/LacI family purine nucleotide synthesis repressor
MQTIADSLDISKATVSLALNDKPGVSHEVRDRIIETAKTLNYKGLRNDDACKKILVLIPGYIRHDSFFFNVIYWSIEHHAMKLGYTAVLTAVSDELQNEEQLPAISHDFNYIGIIAVGIFHKSYMEFLLTKNANVVSVDQCYLNVNMNYILTANIDGCYNITQLLIDNGHRNIGFVGSISVTASIFERWCGYLQALVSNEIEANAQYSILAASPLTSLLSNPDELLPHLEQMPELPTAFVCGGDRIAVALIDALKKLGHSVPNDISVTGFDNLEAASIISPKLTTVNVEREALGIEAVNRLLRISSHPNERAKKIQLYTSLVERDSIKAL